MAALARAGDLEELVFQWTHNGTEYPTGAEVRAYIVDAGVRKWWNGSAFTTTDALLAGTFDASSGTWSLLSWTWPTAAIGKVVTVEAKPTGLADIATEIQYETRRIVEFLPDDVRASLGATGDMADPAGTAHGKLRSLIDEHDGTVMTVEVHQ